MTSLKPRDNDVCTKYNISDATLQQLNLWKDLEIVVVCNDCSIMNQRPPIGSSDFSNRWERLKNVAKMLIEIITVFNSHGCDIYFVNRRALKHLKKKDLDKINETLVHAPRGCGKITSVLNQIIADKFGYALERKLLIILLTDEAPITEQVDWHSLFNILVLSNPPGSVCMSVIPFSREKNDVSRLRNWNESLPMMYLGQDYETESHKILGTWGPQYPFSYADYICHCVSEGVIQVPISLTKLNVYNDQSRRKARRTPRKLIPVRLVFAEFKEALGG
jgi:hypothetical protein